MKKIFLYFGKGVDGLSGRLCYLALKKLYPMHPIQRIKTHQFDAIDFSTCHTFVMPGGRDIYYHQELQGQRALRLLEYVQQGGRYLGICAGGYFGSAIVDFEKGQELELMGTRELQFFPGRAVGSALGLGEFEYQGYRGAKLAYIHSGSKQVATFFNGGCYFAEATKFPNTKVIARYVDNTLPAIVQCNVGSGLAILSGVHFEYDPNYLTKELSLKQIESLRQSNPLAFMKKVLEPFNL